MRIDELIDDTADVASSPRPARRKGVAWPAVAASMAAVALLAAGWGLQQYQAGRLVAPSNTIRRVALEDGSRLVLDASAVIQVRYRAAARDVYLKRGEATFQVAHDPTKPFIVHAGNVDVRAVGTRFAVRLDDGAVQVVVAEGTVEVTRRSSDPRVAIRQQVARNGALVAMGDRVEAEPLPAREVARRLAWSDGLLVFDGQTLATAASEVNRYAERPVVIDDPGLGARPLVGVFKAGDSEAFAKSAGAAFGASVTLEDQAIHIGAR